MNHVSWTEIEGFHHIRNLVKTCPYIMGNFARITYRAKVKLHGTNAGVIISPDGEVTAQSRTRLLSVNAGGQENDEDNKGFAQWVAARAQLFAKLAAKNNNYTGTVVVYGEWCGPGIMKGVAVNKIPERTFAVFAARIVNDVQGTSMFFTEPNMLSLGAMVRDIPGCCTIPWYNEGEQFVIDWSASVEQLQGVLDRINECVVQVETRDPFISDKFGVEGVGEGLVFYPVSHLSYADFESFGFKAKGDKHKVVAHTKPAQLDPTIVASGEAFAEMVVTSARLSQALLAVNGGDEGRFDIKLTAKFLAWLAADIKKEAYLELEASGLEEKTAMSACHNRAREWYVAKCKAL